jgi:hypothetical protein
MSWALRDLVVPSEYHVIVESAEDEDLVSLAASWWSTGDRRSLKQKLGGADGKGRAAKRKIRREKAD